MAIPARQNFCLSLLLPLLISNGLQLETIRAQSASLQLDGSLGVARPLTGPDFRIDAADGRQFGPNLFHSFSRFNLRNHESATFAGPDSVHNIIARVTGNEKSVLDGTIRSTIPRANLYLINPAGIWLGPHADLDVAGSVTLTTADYLTMDGQAFSAHPDEPAVLSSAPPEAFGFLSSAPSPIQLAQSKLETSEGSSFSLIGGDIDMARAHINAPAGRVELLSIRSPGQGSFRSSPAQLDSNPPRLGQVTLHSETVLKAGATAPVIVPANPYALTGQKAIATRGGSISIRAGQIVVDNSAIYESTIAPTETAPSRLEIFARDDLVLRNGSQVATTTHSATEGAAIIINSSTVQVDSGSILKTSTTGSGRGGDVSIHSHRLTVLNGSQVGNDSFGIGDTGNLDIQTRELNVGSEGVAAETTVGTSSFTPGSGGKAGQVHVRAELVRVWNWPGGALVGLGSRTFGKEPSGDVKIQSTILSIEGNNAMGILIGQPATEQTAIGSVNFARDAGRSGNVQIDTHKLSLSGFGIISAATFGQGDAGTIHVRSQEILLDNSSIVSSTAQGSTGAGGNVRVQAGSLAIQNRGGIAARTSGSGNAGDVEVRAEQIDLDFGAISADVMPTSTGHGGQVRVEAGHLTIRNGGGIFASTAASGRAGDVSVLARHLLIDGRTPHEPFSTPNTAATFGGTGVASQTLRRDQGGDGGQVRIAADQLRIVGKYGAISTESFGPGNSGTIDIQANDLVLDQGGRITTSSFGTGNSGRIRALADRSITIQNHSAVSTAAHMSDADGILIRAGTTFQVDHSRISAQAARDGGEIRIAAGNLALARHSRFASEAGRHGGNIQLDPRFAVFDSSDFDASAILGRGGNIHVRSSFYVASSDTRLTVSSRFGIDGLITIFGPAIDMTARIVSMPSTLLDSAPELPEHCKVKLGPELSSFLVLGPGSSPWRLEGWMPSW